MNKTPATDLHRREAKVARRRHRIKKGTRVLRFAGQGRRYDGAPGLGSRLKRAGTNAVPNMHKEGKVRDPKAASPKRFGRWRQRLGFGGRK